MGSLTFASRRIARVVVVAVAVVAVSARAHAAVNQWLGIGPASEPTVHSLAVDPRSPNTIYAGAVGEIWRTTDGGRTWTAVPAPVLGAKSANAIAPCEIRALVIDPRSASTLYAGCFGPMKSIDGGRTWTPIVNGIENGGEVPAVWAIAIDPRNSARLYAGTPFGTVFKSDDGGEHWRNAAALPRGAQVRALAIDPASPDTIYAAATRGGVFKSVNGGADWVSVNAGLPADVTSLAIPAQSLSTLYAGTIDRGIFKTTDGASSWTEVFGPKDVEGTSFTVAELAADPFSPSTVYAAIGDMDLGVFQTTDAGANWRRISAGLPFYGALRALAIAPSSPSTIFVGSTDQYPGLVDGGVFEMTVASRCDRVSITAGKIDEFPVPTANAKPLGITEGPDCALWFTETNKIGRITTSGEISEFAIPTPNSDAARIVTGPDAALWFTESAGNKIGRVTTAGEFTEFPIPTPASFPVGITTGPDGNLWFTEQSGHRIGRITPSGVISEFLIPPLGPFASLPLGITAGRDGNVWFSERFTGRVGRVTPAGTITLFQAPPACCADVGEIASGPDANLWFTERWDNTIVRMTPTGTMQVFPLSSPGFGKGSDFAAYGITAGSDGAMWFTNAPSTIGRITTTGAITLFETPAKNPYPEIITAGPDGNVWFTESSGNNIGRIGVIPADTNPIRRRAARH